MWLQQLLRRLLLPVPLTLKKGKTFGKMYRNAEHCALVLLKLRHLWCVIPRRANGPVNFIDVMDGFAASIDVEVEIVETTWGNMVAGVQAGRWDISSGLNRNPQRALALNYSIPIWSYEIGLLYDTNNPKISADMASLADFDVEGMTIAVMQGAAGDLSVSPQIENARILRLDGANEGRLAIIAKRADVFATDSDIHRITVAQNPDWAVQVLPNPAIAKQGIAFGLRNSVPLEDIQVLDIYLEEQIATGAVQRLYEAAAAAMVE